MKKKTVLNLILLVSAFAIISSGCGRRGEESATEANHSVEAEVKEEAQIIEGTLTAQDDAESIVLTANDAYKKQSKCEIHITSKDIYDTGDAEKVKVVSIADREKGILEYIYKTTNAKQFFTKENNQYYTYILSEYDGEKISVRYRKQPGGQATPYELFEKGTVFNYASKNGFKNVNYENQGEEVIDGANTIKVLVTADITYEEESDAVSVDSKVETYLWVDADSHLPVKLLTKEYTDIANDGSSNEEGGFQNVVESDTKHVYSFGDDCSSLDQLPSDYKEITESQYLNGEY